MILPILSCFVIACKKNKKKGNTHIYALNDASRKSPCKKIFAVSPDVSKEVFVE